MNSRTSSPSTESVIDAGDATLIPGFIQTHVHLCQTLFRGLADDLDAPRLADPEDLPL